MANTNQVILRIKNQTKRFANVVANEKINMQVHEGEIHCLLGENGAGKSTLAECLYGFFRPDSGNFIFKGKDYSPRSPRDAIEAGIGMVHQHFVLSPPMTVMENIVVGIESESIWLDLKSAGRKVDSLCQEYGLDLNLNAVVGQLSVGKQQWVEILKALYVGVDLLILDEPTASLTPQEVKKLFEILGKMKANGLSVILITHKLHEVMEISDRVTVLRKGKLVGTVTTKDVNREKLVNMMVGRAVSFQVTKKLLEPGQAVLELSDLHVLKDSGLPGINGFSLVVHKNEIVGLAGVAGNGQSELFDAIVGVRQLQKGQILLSGEDISNASPDKIIKKGIASIPPDRMTQGLLMGFPIKENLILGWHQSAPFRKGMQLQYGVIGQFAEQAIKDFEVAATSGEQIAKTLSGGNLQKVILARELSHDPRFVIASSPTRGLDVGAMEYVHKRLVELRDSGIGILLISEDLDEVFNVSDRIAVIYNGQVMGIFDANEATREGVGLLMAGFREGAG